MAECAKDVASPILPLPPHVAAQIKSSTAVPTLASVALGLIANSLDAQAQKITINIDYSRGAISVEDDGTGIPPNEFLEGGGLGKAYCGFVVSRKSEVSLIAYRHIQIQQSNRYSRKEWDLFGFCGCLVNSDCHISSLCPRPTWSPNLAPFKTSC